MASVILKHLAKTYANGVRAVSDLSLEIADGEFVVLLGPSGCGKSTTLRLIAGLETLTSGDISIGDRRVNELAPADRDVALVPQNFALYPHMSVYENMAFGLKMRGHSQAEIDSKVRKAAALLSLASLLDRRPHELSGGQRQRVALGRAIVRTPSVFLLDEPLSNLDAQLRAELRTEIARLHRRLKSTIIYVTHDQAEAMTLGDRLVVLNGGVSQQIDTPLDVYRHPANRFVALCVGDMNLLPGQMTNGTFHFSRSETNGESLREVYVGVEVPNGPAELGIRPEDFGAGDETHSLGAVTIEEVERLGAETIAHFALSGSDCTARLSGDARVQPGDRLPLAIVPGAMHVFAADGRRLN